ncbi:MAG: hypothetical protein CMN32_06595 [Saprospirales bacterium]|nr:hypothetical protein [Saprospirales bacterium]
MKRFSSLLFSLLFLSGLSAQSAFEDAFALANIYRANGNSFKPLTKSDAADSTLLQLGIFLEIMNRHYDTIWGDTPTPSPNNLISAYRKNPFFKKYEMPPGVNAEASAMALSMASSVTKSRAEIAASGAGGSGISVARLADGVAKFLVKRTKEELTIAFFEEFREALAENEQLHILFPTTRMILLGIGDQIYNFNAYLDSMRDAFSADLKNMHRNLEKLLVDEQVYILKDTIPALYVAGLFTVTKQLVEKASVPEIIGYLGKDAAFQHTHFDNEPPSLEKVRAALRMTYVISESVKAHSYQSRPWIAPEQFRMLAKDRLALDFYLGLVYEQSKNLSNGTQKVADAFTTDKADLLLRHIGAFVELGEELYEVTQRIETGEYQKNDTLLYQGYFDYLQVAMDIFSSAKKFSAVTFPQDQVLQKKLEEVNFVVERLSVISLDVRRKRYSNVIVQAGLLLNELIDPAYDISCPLLRFGAFMAAISESQNSDDVAAVMETFALPRGSSYIKKHYPFNLAIGSYVGFNTGVEMLPDLSEDDQTGLNAGMGAPIGVAFSWGEKGRNKSASYTFLANVVDIGAFTAFRFTNNDAVDDLPELKFSNIFAPGGAFIYGFPRFPGSFGMFAQKGPNLRKVTADGYEIDATNGWRFGLMLSVDIPLFNLYTKGKESGCVGY